MSGWLVTVAGALIAALAQAGTPAEDAFAAASEWARAVTARDIDTQMKLLPKAIFVRPDSMGHERRMRQHDKELALLNDEKYLSFEVRPAPANLSGTVGKMTMMVFPYSSVVQTRDGKMQRDSYLVAVAEGGSSNWSVMDGSGQSVRSIKIFVPGYAGVPPVPPAMTKMLKAE
jgi:hypothetical protein